MARIVFFTIRFPFPLDKGDKLRAYFQLQYLSRFHEVHLLTADFYEVSPEKIRALEPYCKSIHNFKIGKIRQIFALFKAVFNKLPLQVALYTNNSVKKKIEALVSDISPDFIYCQLLRTSEYVKDIKGVRKTLDYMDAYGKGMERRERSEKNIFRKAVFSSERKRLYYYERKVFEYFDRLCIITEQDRDYIKSPENREICVVSNGVDYTTFYPKTAVKEYDLVFMGHMSYPPNVAAVTYFVKEVFPLILMKRPETILLIAGVEPSVKVKRLASANVKIRGEFTDISDSIAISGIMVAPMLISIGMQNKILQAMAMKVPCVSTSMSNKAIKAPEGTAIIVADSAVEFASAVLELMINPEKYRSVAENGYEFVKKNFSWDDHNFILNNLITGR